MNSKSECNTARWASDDEISDDDASTAPSSPISDCRTTNTCTDFVAQKKVPSNLELYLESNPTDDEILREMHTKTKEQHTKKFPLQLYCEYIVKNDMSHILANIIDGTNSAEQIELFNKAVYHNRRDILDLLIDKGFDLNKESNWHYNGVLRRVFTSRNVDISLCQYFIDKGASLKSICQSFAAQYISPDLLNCILDQITEPFDMFKTLCSYLYGSLYSADGMKFDIVKKIVSIGVDFKNNDLTGIIDIFGNYTVDQMQFLVDNGFPLNNNQLLVGAIYKKNTKLVDYYLENGLVFDKNVVKNIFNDAVETCLDILSNYDLDYSLVNEYVDKNKPFLDMLKKHEANGLNMYGFIINCMR